MKLSKCDSMAIALHNTSHSFTVIDKQLNKISRENGGRRSVTASTSAAVVLAPSSHGDDARDADAEVPRNGRNQDSPVYRRV